MNEIRKPEAFGLKKFDRFASVLFSVALIICLIPVWANPYFLTGDGPCHAYNAQLLLDWFSPAKRAFLSQWYDLNLYVYPNWFSHVFLAVFQKFMPAVFAEKALQSCYIVLFAMGLKWLLATIQPHNRFLVLAGMPFIFVRTFQMGFYNYALSIALCFICVALFIRTLNTMHGWKIGLLAIIHLVLYFTHPVGWLLSVMMMGLILVFRFVQRKDWSKARVRAKLKNSLVFLVCVPGMILMSLYLGRQGINTIENSDTLNELFTHFVELRSLIAMSSHEVALSVWLAILFGVLLISAVLQRLKVRRIVPHDAFFIAFIVTLLIYFFQPGGMAGAGILSVRLQFLPYLFALLWISGSTFTLWMKWAILILSFSLGSALVLIRLPYQYKASIAAKEILKAGESIRPYSVVLPLSYSHNGLDSRGELISNRIWLFKHAGDYIGTTKPLIMLGNYEANAGYFPLRWKPHRNPFAHLGSREGIEGQPPGVDIATYEQKAGVQLDYVLTWFRSSVDPSRLDTVQEHFLNQHFRQVYLSTDGHVALLERTR